MAPPIGEVFVPLVGHEIPVLLLGYTRFGYWQGADIRVLRVLWNFRFETFIGSYGFGFR